MLLSRIFENIDSKEPLFLDVGSSIRDELKETIYSIARGGKVLFHDYCREKFSPYAPFLSAVREQARSIRPYSPHRSLWSGWGSGGLSGEVEEFLLDEVEYEVYRVKKTLLEMVKNWDTQNEGTWIVLHAVHYAQPSLWSLLPDLIAMSLKCRLVITWDSRSLKTSERTGDNLFTVIETLRKKAPVFESYTDSTPVEVCQPQVDMESFWMARNFLAFADGVRFAELLSDNIRENYEEEVAFRQAYADCLLCMGLSDEAVTQYQQAQRISRERGLQDRLVRITRRLSSAALIRGDVAEADRTAQQAYEISMRKLSDKEQVLSLFAVLSSRDNLTSFIQNSEGESIGLLETLVSGLRSFGLNSHLAAFLTNGIVALTYYWKVGPEKALQRCQEGINIARDLGNQYRLATGFHTLGILYQDTDQVKNSLEAYQTSLKYRKQLGVSLNYAQGLNGLGYFHFSRGDFLPSYKAFKEALEILQVTDLYSEISATLYNLGTLFFYARKWDATVHYLESALSILDQQGIDHLPYNHRLDFLAILSISYLQLGKESLSLEREWQARRLFQDLKTSFRYEHFEILLALRDAHDGRVDSGKERFTAILKEADRKIINFRYLKLLVCLEAGISLKEDEYFNEGLSTLKDREDHQYFRTLLEASRDHKPLESYPLPTPLKLDLDRILERGRKDFAIAVLHKKLEEAHFFYSYFDGLLNANTKDDVVEAAYRMLFQTYPAEGLKVWLASDPEEVPANWETVYRPWNQAPNAEQLRWLFEGVPPGWIHVTMGAEDNVPAHALYGPLKRLDKTTERDIKLALNQLILTLRLKITQEKLEQAATLDPLTGLYNRYELERRLAFEEKRIRRHHGRPSTRLSLIKVDLDHFGFFVDHYGHEAGDRILRWFALGIKEAIRESDFAGRVDNNEFLILLTETEATSAPMVARRLLKKIENRSYLWEALQELKPNSLKLERNLGCSIGIAQFTHEESLHLHEAMEVADRALRQAQEQGGNQIVIGS